MAEKIEIVEIKMPPFGKARPRVTRKGTYMPRKYQDKRDLLRGLYHIAGGAYMDAVGPLALNVDFYFRMPKSWSIKKKSEMSGAWCRKVPDLDNLVGAVMDALLMNDQNVVTLRANKYWGYEDNIRIGMIHI